MPELRRPLWKGLFACLFACFGLLAVGGSARAFEEHYGQVKDVQCTVRYDWPKFLNKGFFPVMVRLENRGQEDVVVSLLAQQNWAEEDRVRRRLALGAGESLEFELLLRARTRAYSQYRVTFEVGSDDVEVGGAGPGEYPRSGSERLVLYASAEAVEAGTEEVWSEAWSEAQGVGAGSRGQVGILVSPRTFDQLSPTWQAYTSLDTVVLDVSGGWPREEVLAALLAWCRSGGKLMIAGVDSDRLWNTPGLEGLLDRRFLVEAEEAEFGERGLVAYRCGFGVLIVQREGSQGVDLMGAGSVAMVADEAPFTPPWTRPSFGRHSRQHVALSALSEFGNLPLRSLMLLIIAFAILIGPVNFLWVKRTRKPMMLLVSVPAIAVVTSVVLVLYGVLSQGLDVKSMSASWAVLDQRTGWSTTAEVRRVFAGSAPGEGLRPEARTLIYPERSAWHGNFRSGKLFTLDLTEGRLYGGDYFPVRQPFGQMILSDRTTRLRLEARANGNGVEITNALGSQVQDLLLCGPDGRYHYLGEPLAEGAQARLAQGGFSAKRVEWEGDIERVWGEDAGRLLPGTYIARLAHQPLRDDCGVEVNELEGHHVLVGILDTSAEGWQ